MYRLDTYYDGKLEYTFQFADALQAFEAFSKCCDVGFANELATYNLSMPNGKMYTKNFNRIGLVSQK
jgi:hypothetical protein